MEIVLCFDLHAHSQRTNSFLYGNLTATSPRRCKRQLYIPYILAELTDDYSLHYTNFNTDIDKAGTNRRYSFAKNGLMSRFLRTMGELLDNSCLCYTFEVSFFSYRRKDSENEKPIPYFEASCKLFKLSSDIEVFRQIVRGELGRFNFEVYGGLCPSDWPAGWPAG